uniref:Transcription elongation factor A1 n=1 Tax=Ascaris lumbricoides TaxID=6252 RepID=A0A0M3HH90_ASCLU
MERLTSIRGNKQRILDTLREMKEKLGDNGEPDRELMAKMIASYDLLSAQEEDYMKIMQQIVVRFIISLFSIHFYCKHLEFTV